MISPSTPLIDIADLTRLKATLKIPESKIFAVKEGMAVFLKFDALRDKEFRGRVTRIDQYVNPSTRTSNEIELNNQEAGMSLRLEIRQKPQLSKGKSAAQFPCRNRILPFKRTRILSIRGTRGAA